ncbi:MAG: hypothetical protein B7X06_03040, partial [Verrucomicrobia bacterium 21-51-4]
TDRLEASNAAQFRSDLDKVWNPNIRQVLVDCQDLDFIDSSGIGALLSIQKRLKLGAAPVTLMHAKPGVISVIELLRLHRVFAMQNN